MSTNLSELTTGQLHHIIALKEKIETLQNQIESIAADGNGTLSSASGEPPKKRRRRMSRAGRARIAAAQTARWARVKGKTKSTAKPAKKKDRRSSPTVRAKIAAAARARWAKVKAEGKTTL